MSPLDPQLPPAGEEIHLPGGSVQPLLLTIGTIAAWIRDTRREIDELPLDHG